MSEQQNGAAIPSLAYQRGLEAGRAQMADRITALEAELAEAKAAFEQDQAAIRNLTNILAAKNTELAEARAEAERLREALQRWESYGCPDCGGDCSAANPPVSLCIMRETRAALTPEAKG